MITVAYEADVALRYAICCGEVEISHLNIGSEVGVCWPEPVHISCVYAFGSSAVCGQ